MKHELSTVPLSIAKVGGNMHSTSKAELIDILKGHINIPSELPETDMKTCVLIDGHALIKALGKPNGCQTFGEYADAFFNAVKCYFDRSISRVDILFDRYIGEDSSRLALEQRGLARQNQSERLLMGHMFHFHMYGATSSLWTKTNLILQIFCLR